MIIPEIGQWRACFFWISDLFSLSWHRSWGTPEIVETCWKKLVGLRMPQPCLGFHVKASPVRTNQGKSIHWMNLKPYQPLSAYIIPFKSATACGTITLACFCDLLRTYSSVSKHGYQTYHFWVFAMFDSRRVFERTSYVVSSICGCFFQIYCKWEHRWLLQSRFQKHVAWSWFHRLRDKLRAVNVWS